MFLAFCLANLFLGNIEALGWGDGTVDKVAED